MPGLGARLGRGGSTTYLQDLANSDCVVIMGANMAENHPVGFRFVVNARERGAKIIHIDPRFTRTSAHADVRVPLRAGSDIAFLGGLINYVLTNELWFDEYVRAYTNADVIVGSDYRDTEDLDGLFSGYRPDERRYDHESWQAARVADGTPAADASVRRDPTLQDPRCVFQIVKRHYARYTPAFVAETCGVPEPLFVEVARTIAANSGRERTTAFAYAVAWTQHTTGTQMIGACALLQLLLGNIGRPGGGIMALRGHATIQGSTDIPTLFNLLPGYIPMPEAGARHEHLDDFLHDITAATGWWANAPAYVVSLLKAYFGPNATPDNEFGYGWLPRIAGDYSFQPMLVMMREGQLRGLFCMGQNPAVGGQNAVLARKGLANLDWLVVRDLFEIETAAFWHDAPEVRHGDVRSDQIKTEIFLMPASVTVEKAGSFTNTQRLVQWHEQAVEPPGDCRSEGWFIDQLYHRLIRLYEGEDTPAARQLRAIRWGYDTTGEFGEPDLEHVLAEINGRHVADGSPVHGYGELAADGSTECGCWIYSGIMPAPGQNLAKRRSGDGAAALDWGYAWPNNCRTLYNRASADPDGVPWSERKAWVWWDQARGRWTGHDTPDGPAHRPPGYTPPPDANGIAAHDGHSPFVMTADGKGQLFAFTGLKDGPLPTHYEPWESPTRNRLHPEVPRNPAALSIDAPDNPYHEIADPRFPHVITTYRLTEHHTAGAMTRFVPWLAELQPSGFAEIDPTLANELDVANRDWIVVSTLRGEIEAQALVTDRLTPLEIDGRPVHQIGVPWHFGYSGLATGGIANDLTALVEDPNSLIHEGKSFTCAIRKGRLADRANPS